MSRAVGNDRFQNYASPHSSEQPEGAGGVWWPLRLNDMDQDCAVVVALLNHEMNSAFNQVRSCEYRIAQPHQVRDVSKRYEHYIAAPPEETVLRDLELEVRADVARAQYDYMRELLEAAYVC